MTNKTITKYLVADVIRYTKIFLLVVVSAILVYDIVIAASGNWEATVSNITLWAGIRLAFVPYAWGVLTAHFWLGKPGRFLFGVKRWRFFVWIPISVMVLIIVIVSSMKQNNLAIFLSNNLWISLSLGELVGLLWSQERPKI